MPTAIRPSRSLLAFALVANLLAASAPLTAGAAQQVGGGSAGSATVPVWLSVRDRDSQSSISADATTAGRTTPDGEATAESRQHVIWAHPVGVAKATTPAASGSRNQSPASYKGRNHVWIPALGIDRAVTFYSCSSSFYPGNRVYRWGCAGSNNIYLFGHAHSVFRALHDAYVRGRLFKGMKVFYANAAGKVSTYAVSWWRLTTPDKGGFAYAAQSTPSLTLQTCVGANNQYRLIVRLRRVG